MNAIVTLMFCVFIGCAILSMPLAVAIGVSVFAAVGFWDVPPLHLVVQRMFTGVDSFTLMAVPFFLLAGELMMRVGIIDSLVNLADALVGRIRGGLAHMNVIASALFAGISGSATADVAAVGSIEIRMMARAGYDRTFATAMTVASSVLGAIIPPSILMIVYAAAAPGISIAALFAGGILPGVLMGAGLMAVVAVTASYKKYPKGEHDFSFARLFRAARQAIVAIVMPFIIVGGTLSGVFTPTEASVIAVLYALFIGLFVTRKLKLRDIPEVLVRASITSGTVFVIIAVSNAFSWVLASQQMPQYLISLVLGITQDPEMLTLLVIVVLLFVGSFLEATAALLIMVPILAPLAVQVGIAPVHFAIVCITTIALGLITPPVGLCLYVGAKVGNTSIGGVALALLPLLAVEVAVIVLLVFFPELVLAVPRFLGYQQ